MNERGKAARRDSKKLRRIAQSNEYFECIARIASRALQLPAAAVVTAGPARIELRGSVGIEELGIADHTAFLTSATTPGEPLIVADLSADPRFSSLAIVSGAPRLRFYAGVALADPGGAYGGALSLVNTRARRLGAAEQASIASTLLDLGGLIEHELLMRSMIGSDPLTGLDTAGHAMQEIEREWRRSQRTHQPISALVIDVDQLGRYNDVFGYPAGDRSLRLIAGKLETLFRRSGDMLVRLGGDRILALLVGTDLDDALKIGESSRQQIEAMQLGDREQMIRLTISIGAASVDGDFSGDWQQLLRRASTALRRAKTLGGNRLESETP
ncbi:sensor domain-containing diguanylate cyclase [Hydrocarboniphaga sp.]|uniref:sensor domain-containing diguanylate cyclase n=1 Tax=Hydrocarboniphaga sp. TaxID=2033016 RepID=UPI003D14932C